MQLIVPMAGLGSRFANAGYETPKPLIPVGGKPMVVRVVEHLPRAEKIVFIVHREHVERFDIDTHLRDQFPSCEVVVAPGLTEGQACTVRLAAEVVDPDDDVLIAACDAAHVYDCGKFQALTETPDIDGAVWTYRGECRVAIKQTSYGWVQTDGNRVLNVSCKVPISDQPLDEHVISGFFWFRRASEVFSTIDQLVASDERVNNEFYMDVIPNLYIARNQRIDAFEVDKYIGWGTPEDLHDYEAWEKHFASIGANE